jgi:hypothetical protein
MVRLDFRLTYLLHRFEQSSHPMCREWLQYALTRNVRPLVSENIDESTAVRLITRVRSSNHGSACVAKGSIQGEDCCPTRFRRGLEWERHGRHSHIDPSPPQGRKVAARRWRLTSYSVHVCHGFLDSGHQESDERVLRAGVPERSSTPHARVRTGAARRQHLGIQRPPLYTGGSKQVPTALSTATLVCALWTT